MSASNDANILAISKLHYIPEPLSRRITFTTYIVTLYLHIYYYQEYNVTRGTYSVREEANTNGTYYTYTDSMTSTSAYTPDHVIAYQPTGIISCSYGTVAVGESHTATIDNSSSVPEYYLTTKIVKSAINPPPPPAGDVVVSINDQWLPIGYYTFYTITWYPGLYNYDSKNITGLAYPIPHTCAFIEYNMRHEDMLGNYTYYSLTHEPYIPAGQLAFSAPGGGEPQEEIIALQWTTYFS